MRSINFIALTLISSMSALAICQEVKPLIVHCDVSESVMTPYSVEAELKDSNTTGGKYKFKAATLKFDAKADPNVQYVVLARTPFVPKPPFATYSIFSNLSYSIHSKTSS